MDVDHDGDSSAFQEHVEAAKRLAKLRTQIANSRVERLDTRTGTPPFATNSIQAQSRISHVVQPRPHNGAVLDSGPRHIDEASREHISHALSPAITRDPLIYPGLYAPSGFDMMSILIRVIQRPSPKINIGFIDSACALVLCSATLPDMPILYCSDTFSELTGYSVSEITGRNCRFLQSPTGQIKPGEKRPWDTGIDNNTPGGLLKDLKAKVRSGEETQTCLVNYKKGGKRFENLLTTIPIDWPDGNKYVVGFQADRCKTFG